MDGGSVLNGKPQLLQLVNNPGGGAELRPARLRVLVEIPAQLDHLLAQGFKINFIKCHSRRLT